MMTDEENRVKWKTRLLALVDTVKYEVGLGQPILLKELLEKVNSKLIRSYRLTPREFGHLSRTQRQFLIYRRMEDSRNIEVLFLSSNQGKKQGDKDENN